MRLDNLKTPEKERFLTGDIHFIKEVLEEELDLTKNDLIFFPKEKLEELRGRAKVLATILNLLGN